MGGDRNFNGGVGEVDFQVCLEIDFDFMVTGGGGGCAETKILGKGKGYLFFLILGDEEVGKRRKF